MGSLRRNVLKCFIILVVVAIMVFVYCAGTLRLTEHELVQFTNATPSSLVPSSLKEPFSNKSRSNLSDPFGFRFADSVSENLLRQVMEYERNRESEKLVFMHSKLKPTAHHRVRAITSIPSLPAAAFHYNEPVTSSSISNSIQQQDSLKIFDIPEVRVKSVNCERLIKGDPGELLKADVFQKKNKKHIIPAEQIYEDAMNCPKFISDRNYIQKPVSNEEAEFPLAFSILLFKDVEQFERLLRAIYRPQNMYCIHVDKKSKKAIYDAVLAIVNCFEQNVFMAPQRFKLEWGTFSILQPELSCMKELLKYKKWKYFINLTGQEFPLKTNWEIVQILKIFNGANNLEGTVERRNTERTATKPPTPSNITLTKGSVHIVATRKFIEYIIYNETSLKFREWVKDTYVPDETYFSSLNFNPHLKVPGSYLGIPETDTDKNLFITRFKNWGDGPFNWPCAGKRVRMVCIFAVRDLPLLSTRVELFANKFYVNYEPLALDCLEELHYNRTRLQIPNGPDINRKFYENLDFVRNHF